MSTVAKVEVLQREEDHREEDATAEEEEGAHELIHIERLRDVALVLLRLARPLEPVPTQSLQVTCEVVVSRVEKKYLSPRFSLPFSLYSIIFLLNFSRYFESFAIAKP